MEKIFVGDRGAFAFVQSFIQKMLAEAPGCPVQCWISELREVPSWEVT